MTSRRSFLGSLIALGVAPAIVRADSLMKVKPIILPHTYSKVTVDSLDRVVICNSVVDGYIVCQGDKWYTPPERVAHARPFVLSNEMKDAIYDAHVRGQAIDSRMRDQILAAMRSA